MLATSTANRAFAVPTWIAALMTGARRWLGQHGWPAAASTTPLKTARTQRTKTPVWGCALSGAKLLWAERVICLTSTLRRLVIGAEVWIDGVNVDTGASNRAQFWAPAHLRVSGQNGESEAAQLTGWVNALFAERGWLTGCHRGLGALAVGERPRWWNDALQTIDRLIAELERIGERVTVCNTHHRANEKRTFETTDNPARVVALLRRLRMELSENGIGRDNRAMSA